MYAGDCRASKISTPQSLPLRNSHSGRGGSVFVWPTLTQTQAAVEEEVPGASRGLVVLANIYLLNVPICQALA